MTGLNSESAKYIIGFLALILVLMIIYNGNDYFSDRKMKKEHKKMIKELDEKKEQLENLNKLHQDSISNLKQDNHYLKDSLSNLNKEVNRLENEKPKVIYRVHNMSVSEQQEYFTERYKHGSPRLHNRSSGDSRLGTGRHLLQATRDKESQNSYFGSRYGQS